MAGNKDKLIATAQKLVEKGKLDKAIETFVKYLEEEPGDVRILLKVGDLYAKLSKKPEAVETYLKVARHYGDQGFYLKAVAVYKQVLKLDPARVDVNIRLAELYKQLGLLSDAMQQYEVASNQLHKAGQMHESLDALKQMVELDPENVASRIKLAELYSKEGMAPAAIEEFGRAADQLREQNRIDDWLKVAERLVWHQPENYAMQRELAATYIRKSDARRALAKLQVCFKANARDTQTLSLLAQAFEALGQIPKTVSVLKELARIFHENGQIPDRDQTFQRILDLVPDDSEALEALGRGRRSKPPQAAQASRAAEQPRPAPARAPAPAHSPAPSPPPVARAATGRPAPAAPIRMEEDEAFLVAAPPEAEVEELDFPADQELSEVSELSTSSESPAQEIARILTETDVYIKYGLLDRAVDHLRQVFDRAPDHVEARIKLKDLYVRAARTGDAIDELLGLANRLRRKQPTDAIRFLEEALEIEIENDRARSMLEEMVGAAEARRRIEEIQARADELIPDEDEAVEAQGDVLVETEHSSSGVFPTQPLDPLGDGGLEAATGTFEVEEPLPDFLGGDDALSAPLDLPPNRREITQEVQADELIDPADLPDDLIGLNETPLIEPAPRGSRAVKEPVAEHDTGVSAADVEDATSFGGPAMLGMLADHPSFDESNDVDVDSLPDLSDRSGFASALDAEVDAEIEEADFFVQQGLHDAAKEILDDLLARHPDHPAVKAKLASLSSDGVELEVAPEEEPEENAPAHPGMVDRDAVYDLSRRAIVEKQVSAEDFDTHKDLGIAYKEMGLYDDAIQEFKMVIKAPGQEVFCLTMIGVCYTEKGGFSDGIASFKKALYVEGISEREQLALYYELGRSYERLSDPGEALYYFEKVSKKDAKFRDVEQILDRLKAGMRKTTNGGPNGNGGSNGGVGPPAITDDDIEAALGIEDETDSGVEPRPRP